MIQNCISFVILCYSITALLADDIEEWSAVISAPHSSAKYDNVVAGWTNDSLMYPEEMTASGDVLLGFRVTSKGIVIRTWPEGKIPYVIEDTFSQEQQGMIKHAMSVIQIQTCVTFVPRTDEKDYLSIENKHGCKSYYGRFGGHQELFLQAPACVTKIRTVYHVLLHAIGLIHEHCRPNRSAYVSVSCKNLKTLSRDQTVSYAKNTMFVDVYGFDLPYDYSSIMHYTEYAGSVTGNKTIRPKDKHWIGRIGQREQPSEIDIVRINMMYNCASKLLKSYPFQPS